MKNYLPETQKMEQLGFTLLTQGALLPPAIERDATMQTWQHHNGKWRIHTTPAGAELIGTEFEDGGWRLRARFPAPRTEENLRNYLRQLWPPLFA